MSKILKIKDNIDLKELEKFGWSLVDDTKNNCKYYYKQSDLIPFGDCYFKYWFEYIVLIESYLSFVPREIATFKTLGNDEEIYMESNLEDRYLQEIKEFIEEVEV